MNKNNFKEGSIEQLIFEYWDGEIQKTTDFEDRLMEIDHEELVAFIMNCQTKNLFGNGFIHP